MSVTPQCLARWVSLLLLVAVALLPVGCARSASSSTPTATTPGTSSTTKPSATAPSTTATAPASPAVVFHLSSGGTARVAVEVVDTPSERERGLMNRSSLPPDQGMLFVFVREQAHAFWMKDTFLALDIIFIAQDRLVSGIEADAQPNTTQPRGADFSSRWALEVNAGWAAEHGVQVGDQVEFEGVEDRPE